MNRSPEHPVCQFGQHGKELCKVLPELWHLDVGKGRVLVHAADVIGLAILECGLGSAGILL